MAVNSFLDTSWVSMKVLAFLQNMLEVASSFNTDWESESEPGLGLVKGLCPHTKPAVVPCIPQTGQCP